MRESARPTAANLSNQDALSISLSDKQNSAVHIRFSAREIGQIIHLGTTLRVIGLALPPADGMPKSYTPDIRLDSEQKPQVVVLPAPFG